MMARQWLKLFVIIVVIFVPFIAYKTFETQKIKKIFSTYKKPPVTVSVETAQQETFPDILHSVGVISSMQGVDLKNEVSGLIKKINFIPGITVKSGTVLVQMDNKKEQANLKSLEARIKLADLTYKRELSLLKSKAISQLKIDQSKAELDDAKAIIDLVKVQLSQKQIISPFAGTIGINMIKVGEYIGVGTTIATLQDLSKLYIDFSLPEKDFPKIFIGQNITFSVTAYQNTNFEARSEEVV